MRARQWSIHDGPIIPPFILSPRHFTSFIGTFHFPYLLIAVSCRRTTSNRTTALRIPPMLTNLRMLLTRNHLKFMIPLVTVGGPQLSSPPP